MAKKAVPSREETQDWEAFQGLPLEAILVPRTREDFEAAARDILAHELVGFDTESKPLFSVGQVSDGPHVVQFALPDKAYLFQPARAESLPFLAELLQSPTLLKCGFELKSDKGHIRARLGVEPQGIVDLNSLFHQDGYGPSVGVRGAVALLFQRRFLKSKKITTSNWALPELSPRQKAYAANDAWAALKVAEKLAVERLRVAGQPVVDAAP